MTNRALLAAALAVAQASCGMFYSHEPNGGQQVPHTSLDSAETGQKAALTVEMNARRVHVEVMGTAQCREREMGYTEWVSAFEWRQRFWPLIAGMAGLFGGGLALITTIDPKTFGSSTGTAQQAFGAVAGIGAATLLAYWLMPRRSSASDTKVESHRPVAEWHGDSRECRPQKVRPIAGQKVVLDASFQTTNGSVKWTRTTGPDGAADFDIVPMLSTLARYCGDGEFTVSMPVDRQPSEYEQSPENPTPILVGGENRNFRIGGAFAVAPESLNDPYPQKIAIDCRDRRRQSCVGDRGKDVPATCRAACAAKGGALTCSDKKSRCYALAGPPGPESDAVCGPIFDQCLKENITDQPAFESCVNECQEKQLRALCE